MIEQRRIPTAEADVAATVERASARKFLELLAARDFDRLASSLASDAHALWLDDVLMSLGVDRAAFVGVGRTFLGRPFVHIGVAVAVEIVAFVRRHVLRIGDRRHRGVFGPGVGVLSGGYGEDELQRAGAYRVYADPADLLRHLDELGVRTLD